MPQTTFVLRKALALGHKAIVVINKIDRPDAVIDDVVNRTFDLFVHLGATDEQLDFPIVYTAAIKGTRDARRQQAGYDITPLLDTVLEKIPAPAINADAPLQILVLSLDSGSLQRQDGRRQDSVRFNCPATECDRPRQEMARRFPEKCRTSRSIPALNGRYGTGRGRRNRRGGWAWTR